MELYLATQNKHKIEELSALLAGRFFVKSINELGQVDDIPETGKTIAENSHQKAAFIAEKYGVVCLSDDSGLEVNALQGAPGVYSARYAGNQKNDVDNIQLLLKNLQNTIDRSARFVTVLTFHHQGEFVQFEGEIKGQIIDRPRGSLGFGYDPIFVPNGFSLTFAEMTIEQKNSIAHRAMALQKFLKFIDQSTFFSNQ
jgi:XTP/dITP diphosphohydrolase